VSGDTNTKLAAWLRGEDEEENWARQSSRQRPILSIAPFLTDLKQDEIARTSSTVRQLVKAQFDEVWKNYFFFC